MSSMSRNSFVLTISSIHSASCGRVADTLVFSDILAASLPSTGHIELRKGDSPSAPWLTEGFASNLAVSDLNGVLYRKGDVFVRVVQTSTGFYLRIAAPRLSLKSQLTFLPQTTMTILRSCDDAGIVSDIGPQTWLSRPNAALPLPPGSPHRLPLGTTWWLMDERYQARTENEQLIPTMLKSQPSALSTKRVGPYHIFRWDASIETDLQYSIAQGQQHAWAVQRHLTPQARGFLPSGDFRVDIGMLGDDEELTFINKNHRIGALGLTMTTEDLSISPETQARIESALSLPDIDRLGLILPSRETAVAIHSGLEDPRLFVLYPNAAPQGLYDPFPSPPSGQSWLHELDPSWPRGVRSE